MRLSTLVLPIVIFVSSPLHAAAPPTPATAAAPARVTPAPAQVRLEMRLTRTDAGAAAASDALPAIATPTLTTLDRGTATVSVTNKDLSYSISASPALEQAGKSDSTVQLLWNVRLSGRALPEGTNSVTTTGATRIAPDADETLLTELSIREAKTGNASVFRLTVRVIVTPTTSPGPEVSPVPPASPSMP